MNSTTMPFDEHVAYPVDVHVVPALEARNRLTTAFRLILAIPHLLLVGGPAAAIFSWVWTSDSGSAPNIGAGGGVLGAVAAIAALIAWVAIIFTGKHPEGLWNLTSFYLRWRVRSVAYVALLHDEYPPFGEGEYPVTTTLTMPTGERNRLTVAFRIILAIPHFLALWVLGIAWALTTCLAWLNIIFTASYPESLYKFSVGVLRWSVRVEAYLLLLRDEYPPFSLE